MSSSTTIWRTPAIFLAAACAEALPSVADRSERERAPSSAAPRISWSVIALHKEQARIMATMEKLPEIRKDVRRIKQHLGLEES
jgi:hypothetical protein